MRYKYTISEFKKIKTKTNKVLIQTITRNSYLLSLIKWKKK